MITPGWFSSRGNLLIQNRVVMITIKKYKCYIIPVAILLCAIPALAQGALKFDKNRLDFGKIKKKEDSLVGTFYFSNIGDSSITITSVSVPCSCTVPQWSTGLIAPGQRGKIDILYRPEGNTGPFEKRLMVFVNGRNTGTSLLIKGDLPEPVKTMAETYPYKTGMIRSNVQMLNFGEVSQGVEKKMRISIYNGGNAALDLSLFTTTAPFYAIVLPGEKITPDSVGYLTIAIRPGLNRKVGILSGTVSLKVPGQETLQFSTSAQVIGKLDKEINYNEPQPRLKILKTSHFFGDVMQGNIAETNFEIQNTGERQLRLVTFDANSNNLDIAFSKQKLKKGEKATVFIKCNTKKMTGNWSESVTIHTNAPLNPVVRLFINLNIVNP